MKPILTTRRKFFLLAIPLIFFCICVRAQNQGPPPAVKPGLEIDRSVLMKLISSSDSTITFTQQVDVKGLANYIGTDKYKNSLQLVGKEDELMLAKWTYVLSDKSATVPALTNMGYFMFVMGQQKGVDWLIKKIQSINHDQTKAITEELTLDYDRTAQFKFDPQSKTLTLSFVPWGKTFE